MALTIDQVKALHHGQTLFSTRSFNKKGEPHKIRISGKVQTWKRDPNRVRVPYKHGLYVNGAITESDLNDFSLTEQEVLDSRS